MGRPSKGFRIKPQKGSRILAVAWTDPPGEGQSRGTPRQQSTGESDPSRAAARGAAIYAAAIRGGSAARSVVARRRPAGSLERLAEQWLAARADLDDDKRGTKATYALYFETHLGPYFKTLAGVSPDSVKAYGTARLAKVSASTVRHELSALRMLVRWACPNENADLIVPTLPKTARGTSHEAVTGQRRRGKPTELTEAEVVLIISALPDWSRKPKPKCNTEASEMVCARHFKFPIKARFVVKYETGLREALLDQISVPDHWDPQYPDELRITPELDKMRYARFVPLTPAAQTALGVAASSLPNGGILFGSHDYRSAVRTAARTAGLAAHRVATLAPNDLRHARATHLGAQPNATMAGMMHMFGWTQPSTAARYMHPTAEATRKMLSSAQTVSGREPITISSTVASSPAGAKKNGASTSGASSEPTELLTTSKTALVSLGDESTPTGKLDDEPPHGFG